MNEPDSAVYREILENLLDGVLVVGFDGTVQTLNDAACRILGLRRDGTVGRTFGEIFVETEGFDEFTQIVLDAALSRSSMERHVTDVRIDGRTRSLAVSISYLDAARGGDRAGVIAVITDMTEIREFRENELRLAKEIEAQHGKLRKAYGEIESRNAMLSQMLKKIQVARGMATFLVIGLFMVVGIRYLQPLGDFGLGPVHSLIDSIASAGGPDIAAGGPAPLPTLVVEPRRFSSTISLRGNLAPGKIVEVVSPIESHVVAVHARIGDPVEKGDRLVGLDTGKIVAEHRQAQVDHIRKLDALADLEEWESGTEYAGAERRFRRARISLGNARTLLERTALLLEQGIIPASEHEQASQNHESRLLDYDAAVQELEATRAKGGEDAKRIAALEVENARARLAELGEKLAHDVVHAPISGIVQAPAAGDGKPLAPGRSLAQGELLLTIANFERVSVATQVDEIDVGNIRPGQPARVTGPGFPGMRLDGAVSHVASRARRPARQGGAPRFGISIALDRLEETGRRLLRVGMSAHVTIVTYDNPEALLVPIEAVRRHDGKYWLNVVDRRTGEIEARSVELGVTSLDSVEVVEGIEAGDEVVAVAT